MQLADRISILVKGFFLMTARRLLRNHPPSGWFSVYKKAPQREPFLINSIYLSDYWIPQVAV